MRKWLYIACFGFCWFSALGQATDSTAVEEVVPFSREVFYEEKGMLPIDSLLKAQPNTDNVLHTKHFRENFKNNYQGEEYDYNKTKPRISFWQRIKNRLYSIIDSILGKIPKLVSAETGEILLNAFVVIVSALVLYFLIYFIFSGKAKRLFAKKNKPANPLNVSDIAEDIHEINFSQIIAESERIADYRAALRYRFLNVLKIFSDRKLIDWNLEKTNRDYAKEIQDNSLKKRFEQAAYIFDNVWYGEFAVSENDYQIYKERFNSLTQ